MTMQEINGLMCNEHGFYRKNDYNPYFNKYGLFDDEPTQVSNLVITELDDTSDLEWFASNPEELKDYAGQYVAIYNHEIIGHGNSMKQAILMARKKDVHADPFVTYATENYERIF